MIEEAAGEKKDKINQGSLLSDEMHFCLFLVLSKFFLRNDSAHLMQTQLEMMANSGLRSCLQRKRSTKGVKADTQSHERCCKIII